MSNESTIVRDLQLAAISIGAGAVLGLLVASVMVPFVWEIGPFVGGAMGLITSPLVVACVRRKNWESALLLVYAPTCVVASASICSGDPFLSMGLSVGTLTVASILIGELLPNRPLPEGICVKCGYDPRGNVSGRCPECGTQLPPASKP
ncbi:MAG: hypothetical protein C4547_08755 [Phycisphaerales bacterium]|nr:MAG: hypothetical protein C4547_08755 [Phycisphaerales bacterium]